MINKIKFPLWTLLSFLAVTAVSCKKPDIKGEEIAVQRVNVSFNTRDGQIKIPDRDTGYTKTASTVDVPLQVTLSDAAPARFDIGVTVNNDTVNKMIADNVLPDAVLLPDDAFTLPNLVDVPFGAGHAEFTLKVNLAVFEKYYGKTLVLAVELSDPTKNNTLDAAKKTVVVQINTTSIIPVNEIHYIYFSDAGKSIPIPGAKKNYTVGVGILTAPVSLSYTSTAGKSFYVKVKPNTDTIAKLIADGTLTNTEALTADDFTLPDSVVFNDFNNSVNMPLIVKLPALLAHGGKKVAIALDLADPSIFKIDSAKRTMVLVIDPSGDLQYNPYSGTPIEFPVTAGVSINVKATSFDLGGEGWGYHDNSPSNEGGNFRTGEGVDTENDGNNIGHTNDGEWLNYTIHCAVEGDYDVAVEVASPNDNAGPVHFELDGVNVTGAITLANTTDWQKYAMFRGTMHIPAGKHILRFVWERANANMRGYTFTRKN